MEIVKEVEKQQYVPIEEWPTLEEMADGFSEYKLELSNILVGENVNFIFEDGTVIKHEFINENTLKWSILEGQGKGEYGTERYEVIEQRPGILFVDFYKTKYEEEVTLIWKMESGNIFVAVSGFFEMDGEKRTKTQFLNAVVEGKPGNDPITQSASLVGKRVLYCYSSDDWYEHIYLNRETFSWHCVNGAEKGMADTEKCASFDVADDLTILFWTETIMPVESIILIDLKRRHSTGRFLCWDPKPKQVVHLTFGSLATILNETKYPKELPKLVK